MMLIIQKTESKKLFVKNGDIFLYDLNTGKTKSIINTFSDRESNVLFVNNDQSLQYQKDNNLFQLDLNDGKVTQLTNIKSGSASGERSMTMIKMLG